MVYYLVNTQVGFIELVALTARTITQNFPTHRLVISCTHFCYTLIVQSGIFHVGWLPRDNLLENFSEKLSAVSENTTEKKKNTSF